MNPTAPYFYKLKKENIYGVTRLISRGNMDA